jgi:hypothetical protein
MWLRGSPIKSADASVEEKRIAQERMIEGGRVPAKIVARHMRTTRVKVAASANAKVLSEIFGLDARMHSEIEVLETDPERLLATRGVPALSREAKVVGGKALAEDEIARLLEAA